MKSDRLGYIVLCVNRLSFWLKSGSVYICSADLSLL